MILEIQLEPVKSQTINVNVNGQQCNIQVVDRNGKLTFSLRSKDKSIVENVLCFYANKLVRYSYLGFSGDFYFIDLQGNLDPYYSGLGERFRLYYVQ